MINFLIKEKVVFTIIVVNALAIFINAFPSANAATGGILFWVDYICAVYFVLEMIIKIRFYGFGDYWSSAWNKFDFLIVLISSPVLLSPFFELKAFSVILILRLGRILRLFRLLTFIPNRDSILAGVIRALKASVGVFITLIFLNFMFAMGATLMFGQDAPDFFGNPLISLYSLFKIFTIEGWYEIPDMLAGRADTHLAAFFIRSYFVVSVVIGGILGLSLANAVFVDEMTADNTAKAERLILELKDDIKDLRKEIKQMKSD